MREPLRDVELALVLVGEYNALPLAERGGVFPDVHRDVEDLPLQNVDQLPLRCGVLVVESAHHAGPGEGEVVLDEVHVDSNLRVPLPVPYFEEVTALVAKDFGFDYFQSGKRCFQYVHCHSPPSIMFSRYWP